MIPRQKVSRNSSHRLVGEDATLHHRDGLLAFHQRQQRLLALLGIQPMETDSAVEFGGRCSRLQALLKGRVRRIAFLHERPKAFVNLAL